MKKLFLYIILILTTSFLLSISACVKENIRDFKHNDFLESRGDLPTVGTRCIDDIIAECTGELQIDTFFDTIKIYSNCWARVAWTEYICAENPGGVILSLSLIDVTGWPMPGMCDSVLNHWSYLYNSNQIAQLNEDIIAFQQLVEKTLYQTRVDQLLSLNVWDCNFIQTALLEVNLYTIPCRFTYWVQCGPKTQPIPYIGSCGESCCKSTIFWCRDPVTNESIPSNPLLEQLGSCEGQRIYPYKRCPIVKEGICIGTCEE